MCQFWHFSQSQCQCQWLIHAVVIAPVVVAFPITGVPLAFAAVVRPGHSGGSLASLAFCIRPQHSGRLRPAAISGSSQIWRITRFWPLTAGCWPIAFHAWPFPLPIWHWHSNDAKGKKQQSKDEFTGTGKCLGRAIWGQRRVPCKY